MYEGKVARNYVKIKVCKKSIEKVGKKNTGNVARN